MLKKVIQFIEKLIILGGGRVWFLYGMVLLLIIGPAVTIRFANYSELKEDLTHLTLARRQSVAVSVAQALESQLHRIEDYTLTLSVNPSIREDAAAGRWEEALSIAKSRLELTVEPFVDRIFLADAKGVLQADAPALPGVRGTDFSYRPWFTGVMKTGKVYVTPVYKRTAEPQLNVVAVAAPIFNDRNEIIALIVSQVELGSIAEWVETVEVGGNGFVYVVDQDIQLVTHPLHPLEEAIVDYSSVLPARAVHEGRTGTVIASNGNDTTEYLSAYAPVERYDWGVVVQESTKSAFHAQNATLQKFLNLEWTVGMWNLGVLLLLLTVVHRLVQYLLVQRQPVQPPSPAGQRRTKSP